MELKGKTREGELVTLLSGKDSYTIEVVASEDEKGNRDSLTALIKWCISKNVSEEKVTDLKETLVVNLYRLQEIRKLVERQATNDEIKVVFTELGII